MVLLFNRGVGINGSLKVALLLLNIAQNHIGTGAFFVGRQGSLNMRTRLLKLRFKQFALRDFAIKLRHFKLIRLLIVRQKLRGGDGLLPIAVLLINIEQHFVGLLCHIALLQFQENLLGPVHQARALVVQTQLV